MTATPPNRDWLTTESTKKTGPKPRLISNAAIGITAVVGVTLAAVGYAAGSSTEPEAAPTVTATSYTTELVTAEPVPAPTVTVTETADAAVPQSCLDALADAEEIFDANRDVMIELGEHFTADSALISELAELDYTGVEAYRATTDEFVTTINAATEAIEDSTYGTNAAACELGV